MTHKASGIKMMLCQNVTPLLFFTHKKRTPGAIIKLMSKRTVVINIPRSLILENDAATTRSSSTPTRRFGG